MNARPKLFALAAFLASCLLLSAWPAAAQTQTAVSATITDPSGIPYANGTFSIQLIPTGNNPSVGGAAIQGAFNGSLSATGSFSASLWPNGSITPASTQWQFTICSNSGGIPPPLGTGTQCTPPTAITISGTAQVLSTTLSNVAPSLTHFAGGGAIGTVTSVSCGNLPNIFTCAVATPTTTPALSFTPVSSGPVLDCSQQAGADMGAKLNACIAALPASGGIADATKFSSPQTISTAVVDNKAAVIETCGIAITQTANISFTSANAAWHGCPDQGTVITKGANIDQMTVSANTVKIDYVTLAGVSASFTGNGIVIGTSQHVDIENNTITDEASDEIQLTGNSFYVIISQNQLFAYVAHAIHAIGFNAGYTSWIQHNDIQDTATATGSAVELTQLTWVTENNIYNLHGFLAIHNTQTTSTNASVYSGNALNSAGTGGQVISVAGQDYIHHNTMFNVGANAIIVGGSVITDNNLVKTSAGGDVIDAPTTLRPIIKGNNIGIVVTGVAGTCGINLNSTLGWEGGYVANNSVVFTGTGSGANYGICLTTQSGQFANDMVVENNACISSTGGGTGSACVFFNNTAGVTTNGSNNVIRTNQCIVINVCIARTDAQNLQNYYENNVGAVSSALFAAGGSTNDIIIQTMGANGGGITFANLPTAGNGSQIYTTNATCASVAAAGGNGCLLFRVNGAWTGNQAIVGSDTHTTQITGNYGPVTLLTSTFPTGSYLVTIYAEVSTGVATSTITTSIAYHDDTGAQTQSGAQFSAAVTGTIQSLTFPVRFVTGTALTYSTSTANSPQYKIFARVEAQ